MIVGAARRSFEVLVVWIFMVSSRTTSAFQLKRRNLLQVGAELSVFGLLFEPTDAAVAARGAAELDLEFYMRDLLGGNRKEGNVLPSKPPPLAPPRIIQGPLASLLLDDNCSLNCLPGKALAEIVQETSKMDIKDIEQTLQVRMNDVREKSKRSFYSRAPWNHDHVSDQYYFDLTSYALWKTAAELLPSYTDRDGFVRSLGRQVYGKAVSMDLVTDILTKGSAVETIAAISDILELFQKAGFISGFKLGDEKDDTQLFDELDDEALASGGSVDCLISIYEPATLGASLQITGEQSRFAPDYIGTTLAAVWEKAGIRSSWETFFVDPEYRPNPKDYFPNEQLFQFTLSSMQPVI